MRVEVLRERVWLMLTLVINHNTRLEESMKRTCAAQGRLTSSWIRKYPRNPEAPSSPFLAFPTLPGVTLLGLLSRRFTLLVSELHVGG